MHSVKSQQNTNQYARYRMWSNWLIHNLLVITEYYMCCESIALVDNAQIYVYPGVI